MWPDAKQADTHCTWEQPFPLNSYKLAFTYFYKWRCIYWRQKTAHPTWQAIGTPKWSSLPEFHLHTTSRFERRTFLWSQGPRTGLYQWMAITLHPTPSYILHERRQRSQHNLKLCQKNATSFWRYIACQKSQHTLKLCKNNATLFWGYITCQKVRHTLKLCKNNAPTTAGLTHTSNSNSTLDRVSKPAGTSLQDSTSAMGPYRRQYKTTLYSFFRWLPNWGTAWWWPKINKNCVLL
jgi:hypothetical protein